MSFSVHHHQALSHFRAFGVLLPFAAVLLFAGARSSPTESGVAALSGVPTPPPPDGPATVAGVPADPAPAAVAPSAPTPEVALRMLAGHVARMSHPEALRVAFEAYFAYRDAHPSRVRKPYLYYIDFGLDNGTARGYVFDMDRMEVVDGPFTVAHGSGSSRVRDAVPSAFSNRPGSHQSSLGLYLAQETYTFRGRSGGRPYSSIGLRLQGESGPFNDAARRRGIVVHGAPYVTAASAGRSEGCPAMEQRRADRLLPMLANGGVVFIYSPDDARWLREDPWVRAARAAGH